MLGTKIADLKVPDWVMPSMRKKNIYMHICTYIHRYLPDDATAAFPTPTGTLTNAFV